LLRQWFYKKMVADGVLTSVIWRDVLQHASERFTLRGQNAGERNLDEED
jgi:hypothetical protein